MDETITREKKKRKERGLLPLLREREIERGRLRADMQHLPIAVNKEKKKPHSSTILTLLLSARCTNLSPLAVIVGLPIT